MSTRFVSGRDVRAGVAILVGCVAPACAGTAQDVGTVVRCSPEDERMVRDSLRVTRIVVESGALGPWVDRAWVDRVDTSIADIGPYDGCHDGRIAPSDAECDRPRSARCLEWALGALEEGRPMVVYCADSQHYDTAWHDPDNAELHAYLNRTWLAERRELGVDLDGAAGDPSGFELLTDSYRMSLVQPIVHEFLHALGFQHSCASSSSNQSANNIFGFAVLDTESDSIQYCDQSACDAGAMNILLGANAVHDERGEHRCQCTRDPAAPVLERGEDGDAFGSSLAVGDLNGDGYADAAVGAPGEDDGTGKVLIYVGANIGLVPHALLDQHELGGGRPGDGFGAALVFADLDFDGYDDLVVGAPGAGDAPSSGRVMVFRGSRDGSLRSWNALADPRPASHAEYGYSLATWRHPRQERVMLYVGAPGPSEEGPGGRVLVYRATPSGIEPADVSAWSHPGSRYGHSVAAGNLGVDPDSGGYAVGAPLYENAGRVVIHGGATWTLGQEDAGEAAQEGAWFGEALSVGDMNGDGVDDLQIAAPRRSDAGKRQNGTVYLFEGRASASPAFQTRLSGSGDGDAFGTGLATGRPDGRTALLAIGSPTARSGSVRGGSVSLADADGHARDATGQVLLLTREGKGAPEAADRFGAALAFGDFDGNGEDDLLVGAPGAAPGSEAHAGYVLSFQGREDGTVLARFKGLYQGL